VETYKAISCSFLNFPHPECVTVLLSWYLSVYFGEMTDTEVYNPPAADSLGVIVDPQRRDIQLISV
jgi:hypothetical protein